MDMDWYPHDQSLADNNTQTDKAHNKFCLLCFHVFPNHKFDKTPQSFSVDYYDLEPIKQKFEYSCIYYYNMYFRQIKSIKVKC